MKKIIPKQLSIMGKYYRIDFIWGGELKHLYGFPDYITAGESAVGESFEDVFKGALAH
jgi:hypothetical protein